MRTSARGASSRPTRRRAWLLVLGIVLLSTASGAGRALYRQAHDDDVVHQIAHDVVRKAAAADPRSQVIALRDYLRREIRSDIAPTDERPLLRVSAGTTLQSGVGNCGEITRAFINMAGALGIHAVRVSLDGRNSHVVAEAILTDGSKVIVDAYQPPYVPDLARLEDVMVDGQWSGYYPADPHRFRLHLVTRGFRFEPGLVPTALEKPYLLEAVGLGLVFVLVLVAAAARAISRR